MSVISLIGDLFQPQKGPGAKLCLIPLEPFTGSGSSKDGRLFSGEGHPDKLVRSISLWDSKPSWVFQELIWEPKTKITCLINLGEKRFSLICRFCF